VIVDPRELPATDEKDLTAWILAIYGSPDRREIDGMGGAYILTSKFALVGPPTRNDADVDYKFFQVGVAVPVVATDLNCGNISSAVGPYAIDQGLIEATREWTTVRVHATNFDQMIYLTVPTRDGRVRIAGDTSIHGVPGTGAPITVDFRDTIGTHGGKLLPTGHLKDKLQVDRVGEIEVSFVDIGNLICFMNAKYVGLDGTEMPDAMQDDDELMEKCETIRLHAIVKLGLAKDLQEARAKKLVTPWLVLVAAPKDWKDYATGKMHLAEECDFLARVTVWKKVHKAYPATGSACTGVAAALSGTVLNDVSMKKEQHGAFRIGHPVGTLTVTVNLEQPSDADVRVKEASIIRTARRLMEGTVFAANERLPWLSMPRAAGGEEGPSGDAERALAELST
jgi:methylitaconate Delta-isomerase